MLMVVGWLIVLLRNNQIPKLLLTNKELKNGNNQSKIN